MDSHLLFLFSCSTPVRDGLIDVFLTAGEFALTHKYHVTVRLFVLFLQQNKTENTDNWQRRDCSPITEQTMVALCANQWGAVDTLSMNGTL